MSTKILMVCLGNICRSPMAEGILRNKAEQQELDFEIDSCGTSAYHIGEAPDPRAQMTLKNKGIDISTLSARQFDVEDFEYYDEIFVMDASNYNAVCSQSNNSRLRDKVKLILDESTPGMGASVPDPYYGGDSGFENVYQMLDIACDKFIERING